MSNNCMTDQHARKDKKYNITIMKENIFLLNEHDLISTLNRLNQEAFERAKNELDAQRNEVYLSPRKVAEMLDIHVTTLYRWEKQNYLIPIRIGTKVRYRKSDIEKLLGNRTDK